MYSASRHVYLCRKQKMDKIMIKCVSIAIIGSTIYMSKGIQQLCYWEVGIICHPNPSSDISKWLTNYFYR